MRPVVYDFDKAYEFLRSAWEEKRKINPSFSLRAWAKNLGLSSNTTLSLILAGKRKIPAKYIPMFIEKLSLNPIEGQYLENLIAYNQSKDLKLKRFYADRLNALRPKNAKSLLTQQQIEFISNPNHVVLLEAIDLKDFRSNEKWILEHIDEAMEAQDIKEIISRLIELNLISDVDGHLTRRTGHLNTTDEIPSAAIKLFHKNNAKRAIVAIDKQDLESRDISGHFFNIEKKNLPEIKQAIRSFVGSLLTEYEAKPGCGDASYQLNIQLFKTLDPNL